MNWSRHLTNQAKGTSTTTPAGGGNELHFTPEFPCFASNQLPTAGFCYYLLISVNPILFLILSFLRP